MTQMFGIVLHWRHPLLQLAPTSVDHRHVGVVGGVQPGAPLRRPAPVVGDAAPAASDDVEP